MRTWLRNHVLGDLALAIGWTVGLVITLPVLGVVLVVNRIRERRHGGRSLDSAHIDPASGDRLPIGDDERVLALVRREWS